VDTYFKDAQQILGWAVRRKAKLALDRSKGALRYAMALAAPLDYAQLSESELVGFARRGDHSAFRVIMQRCNQRLFRVARAVVGNDAETEDVLQEAYARAYAAIAGFRGDAAIATWLTRIVLNEARGRVRSRRDTVDVSDIESVPESAQLLNMSGRAPPDDPESDAVRAQIRRILERAIDDLPQPFRRVFILRQIEELSVEETAVHLNLRPETVKTRLHRARRRLRQTLEGQLADVFVGAYPFLGGRCAQFTDAGLARMPSAGPTA
jgi:RNA polymerase sigma-70 factor (ECF subfamily)